MSMTLTLTEDKMKAGTKRLLAELRLAGVNVDSLGYNKALHVFSKALLDKPYEEIKGAYFDKQPKAVPQTQTEFDHHSVFILMCGSNEILVVNGAYEMATNPGTDLEIPFHVLESQAENFANKWNVRCHHLRLPEILGEPESDDEWVKLAADMGYFRREGSIFDQFEADHFFVNGLSTGYDIDPEWHAILEESDDPDSEIIWSPEAEEGFDKYEFYFTFGQLKRAQYRGHGEWVVPCGVQGSEIAIPVKFLQVNNVINFD